jgi:ketosteroid isomerase-like protein
LRFGKTEIFLLEGVDMGRTAEQSFGDLPVGQNINGGLTDDWIKRSAVRDGRSTFPTRRSWARKARTRNLEIPGLVLAHHPGMTAYIASTKMEQAMDSLPTANPELTQFFRQWLETFAFYVREVDYASARPLFHPDVLAFGTHNDVIPGLDQWVATQWDNVWPKTTDFRFVLEQTSVLASPDGRMAIVIAPWTSTGYHPDGQPFPRPGRATMVFSRNADGWLCTHSHMSLNRGVPQASHANRPVKGF